MKSNSNGYSINWFDSFYHNVPTEWTNADITGISAKLPISEYRNVLDVGCGFGRIAVPLSNLGYKVTAIDNFQEAIEVASKQFPKVNFIHADMNEIQSLQLPKKDAALILWHSIGYGSKAENIGILKSIRDQVRSEGLLIFDLFNPKQLEKNLGIKESRGVNVTRVTNSIADGFFEVTIEYQNGHIDRIKFQIWSEQEFIDLCQEMGMTFLEKLAFWREVDAVDDSHARFQLIFQAP